MDYITYTQSHSIPGVIFLARSTTGQPQSAWIVPDPALANGLLFDGRLYPGKVQASIKGGFYLEQCNNKPVFFPNTARLLFIVSASLN